MYLLNNQSWKCFRCGLTFSKKEAAMLHEEISKHTVKLVQMVEQ